MPTEDCTRFQAQALKETGSFYLSLGILALEPEPPCKEVQLPTKKPQERPGGFMEREGGSTSRHPGQGPASELGLLGPWRQSSCHTGIPGNAT